jgi:hypothetical protein
METIDLLVSWKLERLLQRIEATPSQRAEFLAAKDWIFDELQLMREEHRASRQEVLAELSTDQPDAVWLHQRLDEQCARRQQLAHDLLDTVLDLHAQLRPEQRDQLLEIVVSRIGNRPPPFAPEVGGQTPFGGPADHGRRGERIRRFVHDLFQR